MHETDVSVMNQIEYLENQNWIRRLHPPGRIGIIGGGQLGRMITIEAKRMGYRVIVLDPMPDSPAGQLADQQIVAAFSDMAALLKLSQSADVLTYEFEHLDISTLDALEARGARLIPSAKTLEIIQNKYHQKVRLRKIGVQVPDFVRIDSLEALEEAFLAFGGRLVLKTCRDGYDGKGTWIVTEQAQLKPAYEAFAGEEIMAEAFVNFVMEVSILAARGREGVKLYPIAENVHEDGILMYSSVPARLPEETKAEIQRIAMKILEAFDDYGLFCIECFVDEYNHILVNEIAPRPHNSGHYTIEACITSQFEQLLRVITGMPLGSTALLAPCVMWNLLGQGEGRGAYEVRGSERLLSEEACYLHLYGKKETGPLRKLGHVTVLGESIESAQEKAKNVMCSMSIETLEREA